MTSEFYDKVLKQLRGLNTRADTIVCALSGGADSVCLLTALNALSGELGFKTAACHLNHGLRGEESDADEAFCVRLCERLGTELFHRKINVAEFSEKHQSAEETARKVRYGFFDEALEHFGERAVIATAHNADDNAETVLLNLIRGTGLRGLCGIPRERDRVIRPLINIRRDEIEKFLAGIGQDYVTDSTNLSEKYTRNKIRRSIIPLIREINPSFSETTARMTETLRDDEKYLDRAAEDALEKLSEGNGWDALGLSRLPDPVKARAVKKILRGGGIEPSKLRIDTAIGLLKKRGARYNPCKNKFFTIRKGICFTEDIEQHFGGFNEKKP